jgi:hypothetical protein
VQMLTHALTEPEEAGRRRKERVLHALPASDLASARVAAAALAEALVPKPRKRSRPRQRGGPGVGVILSELPSCQAALRCKARQGQVGES